jgi:alanine racemase
MVYLEPMHSGVKISSKNLIHNLKTFRSLVNPKTKIILVVKANAYGHGMKEVVQVLNDEADAFAVDDAQELYSIRFYTDKEVYVLGRVHEDEIDQLIDLEGTPVVYDEGFVKRLDERAHVVGAQIGVNVKVDALLGRQGVLPGEVKLLLDVIRTCKNVSLRGIYAHFANIEDTDNQSHALKQIEVFKNVVAALAEDEAENIETHISSTSGMCAFHEAGFSHARLGVGLYGLWPSVLLQGSLEKEGYELKPVLQWVSSVAQIKNLPAGHPIGYGLTYITEKEMKVAVIPQGYSDGYDRKLSNCGEVLVAGLRCKVLGRIAMNMFIVDVSHVSGVAVGDEVVLIGSQGTDRITAEELADHVGTINYEIVARISPLLPREIV